MKGGWPWLRDRISILLNGRESRNSIYALNRISVFDQLPVHSEDIVFLGDSILNYGEWHEYLDNVRAKNRAIDGDDTHSILGRLAAVVAGNPRHIIVSCGINNLQRKMTTSQTIHEYNQILSYILLQSPNSTVWILPVLPVNAKLYALRIASQFPGVSRPRNSDVDTINSFLESLAADTSRVHYVDMPELLSDMGELRDKYTIDGLHLNGRGLRKIALRLQQSGIGEGQ